MTYNAGIPQATDVISESQGQLLTNFTQLNTIFGFDHVTFNDATAADRGKHDQLTLVQAAGDSATAVDENALYSKNDGGNTRLFFRQENNGTVIQLTGADPVLAAAGSTFLPGLTAGNILVQWANVAATNNVAITFATAFSAAPFVVLFMQDPLAANTRFFTHVGAKAAANWTPRLLSFGGGAAAFQITYLAIGPT